MPSGLREDILHNWTEYIVGYEFSIYTTSPASPAESVMPARIGFQVATRAIRFGIDTSSWNSITVDAFHSISAHNHRVFPWSSASFNIESGIFVQKVKFGDQIFKVAPVASRRAASLVSRNFIHVTCVIAHTVPDFTRPIPDLELLSEHVSPPPLPRDYRRTDHTVYDYVYTNIASQPVFRSWDDFSPSGARPNLNENRSASPSISSRRRREPRVEPKQLYSDFVFFSSDIEKSKQIT